MRCPHCGEPVGQGQDTCFACGEKLRVRRHHSPRSVDIRVVSAAVVCAVLGVGGFLAVHLSTPKEKPKTAGKKERRAVTNAVRQKSEVKVPDTVRLGPDELVSARAREQFARVQARYQAVKEQVLGSKPTPEQQSLMAEIDRQLGLFGRKIGELSGSLTGERREALKKELAEQQRLVNNLISKFARAPKGR